MRPSPWVEEILHLIKPSCGGLHLQGEVALDKELGPNGYVACSDAIVGGAIGGHDLSIQILEYPIGDITSVLIPLVGLKGFSNVALKLCWL